MNEFDQVLYSFSGASVRKHRAYIRDDLVFIHEHPDYAPPGRVISDVIGVSYFYTPKEAIEHHRIYRKLRLQKLEALLKSESKFIEGLELMLREDESEMPPEFFENAVEETVNGFELPGGLRTTRIGL